MNKPAHLTHLEKEIKASGIYESLEVLETKLRSYGQSGVVENHRYEILKEVENIYREIEALNLRLEVISKRSLQWEAPK